MKRALTVLAFLLFAASAAFAQTAGEKESFETMKSAANLYLLNGDFTAAKAQYEGIFKLFRQYDDFTKEVRPDYEYILISGTALYPISGLKYREAVPKLR